MKLAITLAPAVTAVSAPPITAQTLRDQAACNKQAERVFNKDPGSTNFESHFNRRLNTCFVLLRSQKMTPVIEENGTLMDAFGGHVFATYLWTNPEREQAAFVDPTVCVVGGNRCKSREEWDAAVEKYMTD